MRKMNLISTLLSIASCLVIFSIGFSSFYNLTIFPLLSQPTGSFESYEVDPIVNIESMTCFTCSGMSFMAIGYDSNSILNEFQKIDTGTITVNYKIPKDQIPASGKFEIDFYLSYENADKTTLFNDAFAVAGNVCTVKLSNSTVTHSIDENDAITFTKTFVSVPTTEDYTFNVTYEFTIPNANLNFRNTFGKFIKTGDNATTFIASAAAKAVE